MFGDFGGGGNDDNDDDNAEPIWDTQFLHSNDLEDEIPEYDDLGNRLPPSALDPTLDSTLGGLGSPGGGEEEDLLAATQGQLRRVKVENVNYAKRAKRVDVKRLKDAIWKELEGVVVRVEEVRLALSLLFVRCSHKGGESDSTSQQRMLTSLIDGTATDRRLVRTRSPTAIHSLAILSDFPFHHSRLHRRQQHDRPSRERSLHLRHHESPQDLPKREDGRNFDVLLFHLSVTSRERERIEDTVACSVRWWWWWWTGMGWWRSEWRAGRQEEGGGTRGEKVCWWTGSAEGV